MLQNQMLSTNRLDKRKNCGRQYKLFTSLFDFFPLMLFRFACSIPTWEKNHPKAALPNRSRGEKEKGKGRHFVIAC